MTIKKNYYHKYVQPACRHLYMLASLKEELNNVLQCEEQN